MKYEIKNNEYFDLKISDKNSFIYRINQMAPIKFRVVPVIYTSNYQMGFPIETLKSIYREYGRDVLVENYIPSIQVGVFEDKSIERLMRYIGMEKTVIFQKTLIEQIYEKSKIDLVPFVEELDKMFHNIQYDDEYEYVDEIVEQVEESIDEMFKAFNANIDDIVRLILATYKILGFTISTEYSANKAVVKKEFSSTHSFDKNECKFSEGIFGNIYYFPKGYKIEKEGDK